MSAVLTKGDMVFVETPKYFPLVTEHGVVMDFGVSECVVEKWENSNRVNALNINGCFFYYTHGIKMKLSLLSKNKGMKILLGRNTCREQQEVEEGERMK